MKQCVIDFPFTHEDLVVLGFEKNDWVDKGETFVEHKLIVGDALIEITGISVVEIAAKDGYYMELPACKTLDDIKYIIRMFTPKS